MAREHIGRIFRYDFRDSNQCPFGYKPEDFNGRYSTVLLDTNRGSV